jgi:ATP-binding cassette subfamily F protein 3
MLNSHKISKRYNIKQVLEEISFTMNPGDHVGLIGPNGCGKTTLLKIIVGIEQPDRGHITCHPKDLKIGYLAQSFEYEPNATLRDLILQILGNLEKIETEISRLASQIATEPDRVDIQIAYHSALKRLEACQTPEIHPKATLETFGLGDVSDDDKVSTLSGGQKTRLALALAIILDPDLLVLDEPTNHLDVAMLEWLESWINRFSGGVLIVSHDRTFLNKTINRILYLDPDTHRIREYKGNYNDYLDQFQLERDKQLTAYRHQVYETHRIKKDIARTKQQAYQVEITTTPRQPGPRRYAKKVARKAKSREKKLNRFLQSDERVEKPSQSWQMKLEFPKSEHQGQDVLRGENLSIGYTDKQALLEDLNLYIRSGDRIALTGPNGSGKTTLIRTIAGLQKPLVGYLRLGPSVRIGYMSQEQDILDQHLSAFETIQFHASIDETTTRSFLHYFLFSGDDALRLVSDLSFGERSRLVLATLVVQGCNFLLLDEPINHLDIPSRARFEQSLSQFDGTVLAVVHDRYFIRRFATKLWVLNDNDKQLETSEISRI